MGWCSPLLTDREGRFRFDDLNSAMDLYFCRSRLSQRTTSPPRPNLDPGRHTG